MYPSSLKSSQARQIGALAPESFQLITYAKNNYSLHEGGVFTSRKSLKDMLLWTDTLEEPILKKLSKVFVKDALQAFRCITGYFVLLFLDIV